MQAKTSLSVLAGALAGSPNRLFKALRAVVLGGLLSSVLSPGVGAAGGQDLGTSCVHDSQCRSGHCDTGWETSKTDTCVPAQFTGREGDHCTHPKHCITGKCAGLRARNGRWIAGNCTGKQNLGRACAHPSECKSGFCDAGWGTSKTDKCVPGPGQGRSGDYCSKDNQCSSSFCKGLTQGSQGSWSPGRCSNKAALGERCREHYHCGSTVCDAGWNSSKTDRCVPVANRGRFGDYCSNDKHCRTKYCEGLKKNQNGSWRAGTCGPPESDPASYIDKTRVWVRNNTNQYLVLDEPVVKGPTIGWSMGSHFHGKPLSGQKRRYEHDSGRQLRRFGRRVVPPGELVSVLWFDRDKIANGANYSFDLNVGIWMYNDTRWTKKLGNKRLKQKLTGKLVGSSIWFGLDGSAWHADSKWHVHTWKVPKTRVANNAVDQTINVKYRGLPRPGVGGDIEYVFVGPKPKIELSFPAAPRARITVRPGMFRGPFGFDHNPYPRNHKAACSDYEGRGNDHKGIHCYGGHEGTDFMLSGGFPSMDAGGNYAVAAAHGRVVNIVDDRPDRCGMDPAKLQTIGDFIELIKNPTCTTGENRVDIEHANGIKTHYLHLKAGSIPPWLKQAYDAEQSKPEEKRRGILVKCGQVLGEIGSSGKSFSPHLHFDVIDNGAHVDPFPGSETSGRNYWRKIGANGLPRATCPTRHRKPRTRRFGPHKTRKSLPGRPAKPAAEKSKPLPSGKNKSLPGGRP